MKNLTNLLKKFFEFPPIRIEGCSTYIKLLLSINKKMLIKPDFLRYLKF